MPGALFYADSESITSHEQERIKELYVETESARRGDANSEQ